MIPENLYEASGYRTGAINATIEDDDGEDRVVSIPFVAFEVDRLADGEAVTEELVIALPIRLVTPLVRDIYQAALDVVGLGEEEDDEAEGYVDDTEEDA